MIAIKTSASGCESGWVRLFHQVFFHIVPFLCLPKEKEPKERAPVPLGPSDSLALLDAAGILQTRFAQRR
jgi:hypothetical protein